MYNSYQSVPGQVPADVDEAAVGLLKHLDQQQLQELLDDEGKMQSLIDDVPQVRRLDEDKRGQITSNKSIADYNLACEPRLTQAKTQLATTYEQGVQVQKQFEQNKQKLDAVASQQPLDTTLALLETEAAKVDEEAEEIAQSFLDGDVEIEEFISTFMTKKTLAHLRHIKTEKMKELVDGIESGRYGGSTSVSGYAQPATGQQSRPPVPVRPAPYPPGPSAMPDVSAYMAR